MTGATPTSIKEPATTFENNLPPSFKSHISAINALTVTSPTELARPDKNRNNKNIQNQWCKEEKDHLEEENQQLDS